MDIPIVESSVRPLSTSGDCSHEEATAYGKTVSNTETVAIQSSAKEDTISYVDWQELYQRTATIVTSRLELVHPKLTDEECLLVNLLNEEFRSGKSRWTVLEIPKDTPSEIIKNLLKITINGGDLFTRVWFIKEKATDQLIGMFQTSRLDDHGLSEIDRHISQQFCRKGYGTEALMAVFSFYESFSNKTIVMPSLTEYKERITPSLSAVSEFYLEKHDLDSLLREVQETTEDKRHFSSQYLSQLPREIREVAESAIKPLGKSSRSDTSQYRGLRSYASTQPAVVSLRKCAFKKTGEDKWVKYCT